MGGSDLGPASLLELMRASGSLSACPSCNNIFITLPLLFAFIAVAGRPNLQAVSLDFWKRVGSMAASGIILKAPEWASQRQ